MAAMRSLLAAAVAVAAAAFHSAGAGPRAETIYSHANTKIAAFAQDGALVAWFSPSRARCNTVHVISLANPLQTTLPLQGTARNVTCRWVVGSSPVTLALAGGNVLWTLQEQSPIPFDYLVGAGVGVGERKERRFQEIAHTNHGSGLWLGGTRGRRVDARLRRHRDRLRRRGGLPRGHGQLRARGLRRRRLPDVGPTGAEAHLRHGLRRRGRSRGVDGRRRVRPGRRRRQAGPAARGRRPADRDRRRADRRCDLPASAPQGTPLAITLSAARPCDARAHTARRYASRGTTARPARRRARCRCRARRARRSPPPTARSSTTSGARSELSTSKPTTCARSRAQQRSPSGCRSRVNASPGPRT